MRKFKKFLCAALASTMVLAMAAPSFAAPDSGSSIVDPSDDNYKTGSITIKGALKDQKYNIYKIFDLDSYSYSDKVVNDQGVSDITNGLYSYKIATGWAGFFTEGEAGKNYVSFDENGYVSGWVTNASVEEFAKAALKYANDHDDTIFSVGGPYEYNGSGDKGDINISNLSLGYYLVDSTTGALCSLNTTDSNAVIIEKNEVPTVDKTINGSANNSAEIGQEIEFTVVIHAKKGAENYKLHDKMDNALDFKEVKSVTVTKNGETTGTPVENVTDSTGENPRGYKQLGANVDDECDFEIEFTKAFCDSLDDGDDITVTYTATLNSNAVVGTGYENDADLEYGDNKHSVTSTTTTKTWDVDIFKYTGTNTGLENAVFSLTDANNRKIKVNANPVIGNDGIAVYTVDPNGTEDITTKASGHITIKGLASGTYTLKEEVAPNGYNKLTQPLTIVIADANTTYKVEGNDVLVGEGNTLYNSGVVDEVSVLNNTGTILPSTGGIGTTIFYAVGIILMAGAVFFVVRRKRA